MKPTITAKDLAFIAAFVFLVVGIVIGMLTLIVIGAVAAVAILLLTAIMMFRRQSAAKKAAEAKRKAKHDELYAK